MPCERSRFPILLWSWERRIGFRLFELARAFDPVKEINLHLFPNDHPEAWVLAATSNRSLVWPFTPHPGFRFPTTGEYHMAHIGVDLHTNSFTICRLEADGSQAFATYQLAEADLERFCLSIDADDEVAVEATGNTAWFCDEIRPCVGRIVVVNPRQFQVIRRSVKKTDKNDARALATFLSKDLLPETRLKRPGEAELASLAQTRDMLVKSRTKVLNKIHGIFNRHGIKLKKEGFSDKRLKSLEIENFGGVEKIELTVLRDQALELTATIRTIDKALAEAASALDGFEEITSIKGVGARAAAIFLSGIGDVRDFATADKLAAYVGIVPRVASSNGVTQYGRITKQGNKLVRTTLVQCTLSAIRYSGYLSAFYRRIKERRGSGKAIIATARKFLTIIYNTLKNRWIFEDFPAFKLRKFGQMAGQTS